MRPIDADTVCSVCLCDYTECPSAETGDCIIKDVPTLTLDDLRPHGRWVSVPHKLARVCSVCNRDEPYKFADIGANVYDYCPHCGAKMDGGDTQ